MSKSKIEESIKLYNVKPLNLQENKEYLYTGGALTEKVVYKKNNTGKRLFEFKDSKNTFELSPQDVMKYIKSQTILSRSLKIK